MNNYYTFDLRFLQDLAPSMLTNLRTYCLPVLTLLLVSYGVSTFQHLLVEVYYEIAATAQITNSIYIFNENKKHDHSQEVALADLRQLKERSQQQKQEQQQHHHQQLKKQVKIINEISDFSDCFTPKPLKNFKPIFLLSSVVQQISLPPPKFFS